MKSSKLCNAVLPSADESEFVLTKRLLSSYREKAVLDLLCPTNKDLCKEEEVFVVCLYNNRHILVP